MINKSIRNKSHPEEIISKQQFAYFPDLVLYPNNSYMKELYDIGLRAKTGG